MSRDAVLAGAREKSLILPNMLDVGASRSMVASEITVLSMYLMSAQGAQRGQKAF